MQIIGVLVYYPHQRWDALDPTFWALAKIPSRGNKAIPAPWSESFKTEHSPKKARRSLCVSRSAQ